MSKYLLSNRNMGFQKGISMLELLITIALIGILFGTVTFNLIRVQSNTSAQINLDKLISDIKTQQGKAMTGATEGRITSDNYGIYFQPNQYVLFHGAVYSPNEPSNFTVDLPDDLEIQSTTLPDNTLIFSQLSGEMIGFSETENTITIRSVNTGEQTSVTLNRYGVIEQIN